MTARSYRESLDFLFARTTGQWKLGLERIEALLGALGDPQRRLRTLHVAGTNGKGSVCASLDTVYRARGLRVAKYTSPHLVDFRERFLVDGVPVTEAAIVAFLDRWTPTVERLGATFFEATTAMAFHLFAEAEVDVAIIETGLGGRLDASNAHVPMVAGVTNIGLDHVEWLGHTRERIAPEKAGIYKAGVPAVVGEPDTPIREILRSEAARRGAGPIRVVAEEGLAADVRVTAAGTSFRWEPLPGRLGVGAAAAGGGSGGDAGRRAAGPLDVTIALPGRHQASNAMVALTMLDAVPGPLRVPAAEAIPALARVRLPGRFSRHGAWIFDVAHNPDGAEVTAATLRAVAPAAPVVALVSVLGDKDWRGILRALGGAVDRFLLTNAPTAPASRAWVAAEALEFAKARGYQAELEPDFDRALAVAPSRGVTVLVTGSFHTVGDAMARLQVSPTPG
ncbi:MAG: bifunctional folylpolyglutamate synthase/dihydrofolate synthase [Gemmatimonadaceae bacterium]|nr:bifunctional folylpolyglutamate synthase/dihydrofolate synthase [Gemmatimonadaceae bacterium]